tara:strand:+ start:8050 stop:9273 length:1224 start_codon:yes stop_codon:yes gene_type:complete
MKILLISSSPYQHAESPLLGVFQKDQLNALVAEGHEVGLISPAGRSLRYIKNILGKKPFSDSSASTKILKNQRFNIFPRLRYLERLFFVYKGRQLFKQYIKKYGLPDLIHAHNGIYAGILAQDLSINAGINSGSAAIRSGHAAIPYVVTEHSSWILKSHYQGQVKLLLQQAYQQANAVIAVSESLASKMKFDFCVSEVLVVPNIIPSEFQHYSGSIATRTEKETSSEQDTCYINVASLDHNKNQQLLLESFREILALKPMAWLRIIGDGPNKALLVAMAHRLGITHRVEFLGALPRKEVARYLLMSDVFLLSSLVETFGVVAIEANAMGLPVVSTPCGGIADIIESGVNGVLCKDFTVESYVACIREADGLLLEVDKSQVRLATLTKFGPATVARSLAGIYQSVMSE